MYFIGMSKPQDFVHLGFKVRKSNNLTIIWPKRERGKKAERGRVSKITKLKLLENPVCPLPRPSPHSPQ